VFSKIGALLVPTASTMSGFSPSCKRRNDPLHNTGTYPERPADLEDAIAIALCPQFFYSSLH
jgi:hypothetical protein